ncbi:MAG: EAL and HDOD domain-containing protein [Propionicimonas sp.]
MWFEEGEQASGTYRSTELSPARQRIDDLEVDSDRWPGRDRGPPQGRRRRPQGWAWCADGRIMTMQSSSGQLPVVPVSDVWLIGRQPILDRQERITAYALLFRSPGEDRANIVHPVTATATVILGTLSGFGVEQILGGQQGFVSVDEYLLFDDALELMPRESVLLTLLQSVRPTEAVVLRCEQLAAEGWKFALDDRGDSSEYEPLYPLVEVLRIDISTSSLETIGRFVERLRRYPMRLLAQKVETRQQFQDCYDLGFDLFQGYYFARPVTMKHSRIDQSAAPLLKLLRLLMDDADIREIEQVFRSSSPGLTYELLTLVNSVSMGLSHRIGTVRQAIAMLGRQQMRRWVQLALFGAGREQGLDNPLLDTAAVRANFMEQLALRHPILGKSREAPDEAFMVGILSMLDTLYEVPIDDLVSQLHLSERVSLALVRRDGPYGGLLSLVEHLERGRVDEALDQIQALQMTREQVLEAQWKAFGWRGPVTSHA